LLGSPGRASFGNVGSRLLGGMLRLFFRVSPRLDRKRSIDERPTRTPRAASWRRNSSSVTSGSAATSWRTNSAWSASP
jgi:hypothetical protein